MLLCFFSPSNWSQVALWSNWSCSPPYGPTLLYGYLHCTKDVCAMTEGLFVSCLNEWFPLPWACLPILWQWYSGTDTHLKKSGVFQPFSMFIVENKLSLQKVKLKNSEPLSGDDKCSGCIWGHPVVFCYRNRHRKRERERENPYALGLEWGLVNLHQL